jgi:hypothetical protein
MHWGNDGVSGLLPDAQAGVPVHDTKASQKAKRKGQNMKAGVTA